MKSFLKSKTVHFNLWAPVIYAILTAVGIAIPVSLPVILIAGNGLLRLITKEPVVVKKPKEATEEDVQKP